ncbi:MAG: InlB B-repeat-containing protein [Spirochaetia bacterium]|nr:InlB B-repeat-containing protein [Spirochaetia bacterium]
MMKISSQFYVLISIVGLAALIFFGCSNPNNIAELAEETTTETETTSKYTVNFESNGGSSVADITGVTESSTITAPSEPMKSGYVFDGWYKDSGLTTAWDFSNDTVTTDLTLYAKWSLPTEYTVSFNSNGGTSVADITGVTEGSTITAPSEPSKEGFRFTGWFKEVSLTTASDF